jgi:hypothetical protein
MVSNETSAPTNESGGDFVFPKRKAAKRKADSDSAMEIVHGVEGVSIQEVMNNTVHIFFAHFNLEANKITIQAFVQ